MTIEEKTKQLLNKNIAKLFYDTSIVLRMKKCI